MIGVQEFVNDTSNRGAFQGFTHMGVCGEPGNGAFVQFWLLIEDETIVRCHYATHGCVWSIACSGACARLATHRPLAKALLIEPSDIDLFLGGIAEGKGEYADMAIKALRGALGGI